MRARVLRLWERMTVQLRMLLVVLAALSIFVFALGASQRVTGDSARLFIFFNLFLAWIPLVLSIVIADGRPRAQRWWWVALGVWLLFLPNSPYVLTDVLHLRWVREEPNWRFTIEIITLALTGLLLGMLSLQLVHSELRRRWGRARAWWAIVAAIGLASFGVSIGRFGRWNSWDTITAPGPLLSDVASRLFLPQRHLAGTFTTLALSVMLLLIYVFMYALAGGPLLVSERRREPSSWSPDRDDATR
jgi:uncharacterized membrane protein